MIRQALDLFCQSVPSERLRRLDDAGMQHPPPLLEQTAVGHLVRQGMLEGVLALRKEARLVEELSGLEVGKTTMQTHFRQLGDGLQEGEGYFVPNHRGGLEEVFLLGWQPVDARR